MYIKVPQYYIRLLDTKLKKKDKSVQKNDVIDI